MNLPITTTKAAGAAFAADALVRVPLDVCGYCLRGDGGECHYPGCAFWMSDAPDEAVAQRMRDMVASAGSR